MLTVFSIYQYVNDKLKKTEKGTSAYDALWDVRQFIRTNMNTSYGMSSDKTSMPKYDEELEMKKFAECLNKLTTKENNNNEDIY